MLHSGGQVNMTDFCKIEYSCVEYLWQRRQAWMIWLNILVDIVEYLWQRGQAWMIWLNILVDIVYIGYLYKDMCRQSLTSAPWPASWWGLQWWSRSPCTALPDHHVGWHKQPMSSSSEPWLSSLPWFGLRSGRITLVYVSVFVLTLCENYHWHHHWPSL